MKPEADYSGAERAELFELYKIAVDEYRFEVQLNWERTKYYFTLSAALSGTAIGLLRFHSHFFERLLIAGFFFVAAVVCVVGTRAIGKGQEYYRRADEHMKELEAQLQLHERKRGLRTTFGMQERSRSIVHGDRSSRKNVRWTIVGSSRSLLSLMAILDFIASVATAVTAMPGSPGVDPAANLTTGDSVDVARTPVASRSHAEDAPSPTPAPSVSGVALTEDSTSLPAPSGTQARPAGGIASSSPP